MYDISKEIGLENKEVITKGKSLGIAAARVASSSLDKITAEYLEQQLILEHPNLAAPPSVTSPIAAQPNEPMVVVRAPPPETEAQHAPETATETATALLEPEPPQAQPINPFAEPSLPH